MPDPASAVRLVLVSILMLVTGWAAGEPVSLHRGVVIEVPQGWRIAEKWESERSKDGQELADPAIADAMRRSPGSTEDLVILAKYSAEHVGLNPSIQISRTPLPAAFVGATPEKVIEAAFPVLTRAFHDVRVEQWVPQLTVGGRPAAQATVTYTLKGKSGSVTAARASIVVVPDGEAFFVVGYSSPLSGEEDVRSIFKEFLASIRLRKPAV